MLKFLRKYRKSLLAVGGTILMIAFLLPDAATRIAGNPMKRAVADADGRAITELDLTEAERELRAIAAMDPSREGALLSRMLQAENREHWLLLAREAEESGFVGGPGDAQQFLRTLADSLVAAQVQAASRMGMNVTPEDVAGLTQQIAEEMRIRRRRAIGEYTEPVVDRALARAQGVLRMYEEHLGAATLSGPEAEAMARRFFDEVKVDYALLSVDAAAAAQAEPTEEQITRQFERYKSVAAGKGEHGFGYRQPAAIQLEWIKIDRGALERSVKIDPVKAYTHWQQNKARFDGDFAKARDAVEGELRRLARDELMLETERLVRAEIVRGERDLTADGKFKKTPEGWEQSKPHYGTIIRTVFDTLREKRGVTEQPVFAPEMSALFTRSAIAALDIGGSQLSAGPQRIPFDAVAFSTREIDPSSPYGVQAGVTAGPTQDGAGNQYFFRIIGSRAESPPAELGDVRSQIVSDLKRLAAYEAIAARAEEIRLNAAAGFEQAAADAGATVVTGVGVLRTEMRGAGGMGVDRVFNTEAARSAILERGAALDPTLEPGEIPARDRTLAIALPEALTLAIVRISSLEPVSLDDYRMLDARLDEQSKRELMERGGWPFSLESMTARHSFKVRRENRAEETPAAEDATSGEAEAARGS